MSEFIGSIVWMIVSLGLLVTFHEFGHFWVARRCGVRVLRFSVGFGKPLWSRRDRHGTEFAIAAIPLGGYVSMADERVADVAPEDLGSAFNRKSVWKRIAIVAAGPAANFILCVALLWAMFVIGREDYSATVGSAQGMAQAAGLRAGDRVVRVGDTATASWGDATTALLLAAMDRKDVELELQSAGASNRHARLPLSTLPEGFAETRVLELAGIGWGWQGSAPPLVARVVDGSPAAGQVRAGDRITAVDGRPTPTTESVVRAVQAWGAATRSTGRTLPLVVERDSARVALALSPRQGVNPAAPRDWGLGVAFAPAPARAYDVTTRLGPIAAIPAAFRETARLTGESLGLMRRIVTGDASTKNIAGPITLARAANSTAQRGVSWFLTFLALMSLSLGIVNLLPIPILDGGHLLYYLIELVKGSPVTERAMAAGQYVGLALLAGLMGLAFYNDLLGLVPT